MDDAFLELERGSLDPELRSVCAAALTARGDPRGEFLALDLELSATPVQKLVVWPLWRDRSTEFKERQLALDALARSLDPGWVARVGARSHLRFHPSTSSDRPGKPPTPLPGSLREADMERRPARAELLNHAATILQSFRWVLPDPVVEIAVQGFNLSTEVWVSPVYWRTPPPRPDDPYVLAMCAPPPDRLAGIRFIREVTGCNLLAAKQRLDSLPCVLLETYELGEVKAMAARAMALGAQVSLHGERFPPDEPPLLEEGASLLEAGSPRLVVLRADEHCLEVRDPAIRWTGPHSNERVHVLRARWRWSELPSDPAERIETVRPAIEAAIAARRALFVECRLCRELNPPERLHSEDVCMGCAEEHLGVVY